MFNDNKDFFPTPTKVIEMMTSDMDLSNAVILEPSAGSGNIVNFLTDRGAEVIACEIEPRLRRMLDCRILSDDFLELKSSDVSHITHIIMNPPFSADDKHIIHAWEIAPDGCSIVALCNWETINNTFSKSRKILRAIIEENGKLDYFGDCFSDSERKTGVEVACVYLQKPAVKGEDEFHGFMMDEEEEAQKEGIQRYNFVRDLVGRYIGAVKIFDKQLYYAVEMNNLTNTFYKSKIGLNMTLKEAAITREEYKKDLQKSAWMHVFDKMGMQKYLTKGVKDEVNRFVEKQHSIPFTMSNIYNMINIIVGTQRSRMDKALEEVFEKLTKHHHDNRHEVEGWKTNSHYLVNKIFIMPYLTEVGYQGQMTIRYGAHNLELIEDLMKALCYILGKDYNQCLPFYQRCNHPSMEPIVWGKWFDWEFFEVKGFKKGTMHFKFKDEMVWGKFNQEIARIKGYPLFQPKPQKV